MISTTYLYLDANIYDRFIFHLKVSSLFKLIENAVPNYQLITCDELFAEISDVCNREKFIQEAKKTILQTTLHKYHLK